MKEELFARLLDLCICATNEAKFYAIRKEFLQAEPFARAKAFHCLKFSVKPGDEREAQEILKILRGVPGMPDLTAEEIIHAPSPSMKLVSGGKDSMSSGSPKLTSKEADAIVKDIKSGEVGDEIKVQQMLDEARILFQKATIVRKRLDATSVAINTDPSKYEPKGVVAVGLLIHADEMELKECQLRISQIYNALSAMPGEEARAAAARILQMNEDYMDVERAGAEARHNARIAGGGTK